ncbi:MAG: hypothetical protein BWY99_02657 [Synergistetes bacterium ADurb.BinA166]|nr:MAG: hypothetical protein BWY99_02657 [Synergistetes bacterium ADurb.BinA166]
MIPYCMVIGMSTKSNSCPWTLWAVHAYATLSTDLASSILKVNTLSTYLGTLAS